MRTKINLVIVVALIAIFFLVGCAPKAILSGEEITIGGYQTVQFKIEKMQKGKVTPERSIEILEEQSRSQTNLLLERQLREAIASNDDNTIEDILKRMDAVNFGASSEYRYLKAVNKSSKYAITMNNGPFAGVTLGPGEKTKDRRPFPMGIFQLSYKWYNVQGNNKGINNRNIMVGEKRTNPIEFFD